MQSSLPCRPIMQCSFLSIVVHNCTLLTLSTLMSKYPDVLVELYYTHICMYICVDLILQILLLIACMPRTPPKTVAPLRGLFQSQNVPTACVCTVTPGLCKFVAKALRSSKLVVSAAGLFAKWWHYLAHWVSRI